MLWEHTWESSPTPGIQGGLPAGSYISAGTGRMEVSPKKEE